MALYQEAEKLINDIYWTDTHDSSSKLHLPQLIEERLIDDNAKKDPEYYKHREGVVHATSLSKCLRGVLHEMLGAKKDNEIDPRKLGIFKAGNLFEDFIIQALGERVIHSQREYEYRYKNITLVGRSDYTINDNGVTRVGENKSVHSDSFWYRERSGTLVAWNNQVQLQIYLWLERELNPYVCSVCGWVKLANFTPKCSNCNDPDSVMNYPSLVGEVYRLENPQGIFSYISKDDCMVAGAPIKFNRRVVDEIIVPALDIISEGYAKKDPTVAPLPSMVVFSPPKNQYQKNWLATYCEYHALCAGAGWLNEATNLVTTRNRELKESMSGVVKPKKTKPKIEVVG